MWVIEDDAMAEVHQLIEDLPESDEEFPDQSKIDSFEPLLLAVVKIITSARQVEDGEAG